MAADYSGVNAPKAADPKPSNILSPGNFGGRKRVMVDSYTFAAITSGKTVAVGGTLPAGAIITGIQIAAAALGSGVTISVGDANVAALYKSAVAFTSAGSDATMLVAGQNYIVGTTAGDDQILLTVGGNTATGLIQVAIEYTTD